jgi:hypothetical protein
MDKTKVVYIVLGAAAGGLVGYLVGDFIATKIYNSRFEVNDESVVVDELNKWFPEEDDGIVVLKENQEKEPPVGARRIINYAADKGSLAELASKYKDDDKVEKIQIVGEDGFAETRYHVIELTFYDEDGVFTDVNGEMVINPAELVGEDLPYQFGIMDGQDPDIVYILNHSLTVAYEVTAVHGSYQELILGDEPEPELPPDPPKTTKSKRARRAATPKPKVDKVDDETGEVTSEEPE